MNLIEIFKESLKDIEFWNDLKINISKKKNISGKLFEVFTKYYFLNEPRVKDDYINVWLYDEIPNNVKENLNIGSVEHGVDLVLEDLNSNYCAVQCKFRSNESIKLSWTKDKIGNLGGLILDI